MTRSDSLTLLADWARGHDMRWTIVDRGAQLDAARLGNDAVRAINDLIVVPDCDRLCGTTTNITPYVIERARRATAAALRAVGLGREL